MGYKHGDMHFHPSIKGPGLHPTCEAPLVRVQKGPMSPQKSPIHLQKSPISAKEPYVSTKEPYTYIFILVYRALDFIRLAKLRWCGCKRGLYLHKRALQIRQKALYICTRDLCIHKRALHLHFRLSIRGPGLHPTCEALQVRVQKGPTSPKKHPLYPQKSLIYPQKRCMHP